MNFNRIDETDNPGEFIAFLDTVSRNEGIMAMKRRTYELLDARARPENPGSRLRNR